MLVKNKKAQIKDTVNEFAQNVGLFAMGTAMAVGFVEFAGAHGSRAVVPVSAALSPAGEHQGPEPMRKDREETGPHYISYGAMHRTPGRTGSV